MRVAHVHRIRAVGGSERHLLTLLPGLAELGIEPVLVGLDDHSGDPEPFYRALGVPAVRLDNPRDLDPALLARLVRSLHADVVHTHLVHADAYGAIAARLRGTRLVSTKHNADPFRAGPFRYVERALALLADRIVTISEALRRFNVDVVGLPAAKLAVIHYGLDAPPEPWGENSPDPVPHDVPLLVTIARLDSQKGIDVLLRALPELADFWLAVLGEGPQRPALEQLARELGVEQRVYLPGRVPDVAAWLRRADAVVHPARWEGFGLVAVEALRSGTPVICNMAGALPDIVEHGASGYHVDFEDSGCPLQHAAVSSSVRVSRPEPDGWSTDATR